MGKLVFRQLLVIAILMTIAASLSAREHVDKVKAWLDGHADAATINVNGNWYAKEWGKIVLTQSGGSRDITGTGDGWAIRGVVSGNQVFLAFSSHGALGYTAILAANGENTLDGGYSRGFVEDKSKTKPMHLTKR